MATPLHGRALDSLAPLLQLLKDLHYDPGAAHPWACLGMMTMEGPATEKTDRALEQLVAARSRCLEQLPAVLQRRHRDKGGPAERWKQLGRRRRWNSS